MSVQIPIDVIFNHILKDFPITEKLKLKCVCQAWYSRIYQEISKKNISGLFLLSLRKVRYAVIEYHGIWHQHTKLTVVCNSHNEALKQKLKIVEEIPNSQFTITKISPPNNEYWIVICEVCGIVKYYYDPFYMYHRYNYQLIWKKRWVNKRHNC